MMKKNISILIAESVTDLANLLASYFSQQGFDVCIASNGVIAKKQILSQHFDFMITDVIMPEVDGLQLLSWLNEHKIALNVVVTSGINFDLLILPNEENIIMRLAKPYNQEKLLALVTKLSSHQTAK